MAARALPHRRYRPANTAAIPNRRPPSTAMNSRRLRQNLIYPSRASQWIKLEGGGQQGNLGAGVRPFPFKRANGRLWAIAGRPGGDASPLFPCGNMAGR